MSNIEFNEEMNQTLINESDYQSIACKYPFRTVVYYGNMNLVSFFINKVNVDIYACDYDAFEIAAQMGHLNILNYLFLKMRQDNNQKENLEYVVNKCFFIICENFHGHYFYSSDIYPNHLLDILTYLFFFDVKIDINKGLIKACSSKVINQSQLNQLKIVTFLINKGADIHYENDKALCKAAIYGYHNIVGFLLETGCNSNNIVNDQYVLISVITHLLESESTEYLSVLKILIKYGLNINKVERTIVDKFQLDWSRVNMKTNEECLILLRNIDPDEEYYICSKINHHIYSKKSMDDAKKFICFYCWIPLIKIIYINNE